MLTAALAFCCAVEIKDSEKPQSTAQTVVTLGGKNEKVIYLTFDAGCGFRNAVLLQLWVEVLL